ncbi:MAG TPA: DNA-processing protein DprA [Tissierellaceae bacterium]|nr:DNA-processing protein DprA [Tissierellaceae bacterium]
MDISQRDVLIWLNSLGIGSSNIDKILIYFNDLLDLWNAENKQIESMNTVSSKIKERIINNKNIGYLKEFFFNIEKSNIKIITIYDENYPKRLRYIDYNPKVIYMKGNIIEEDNLAIAIVGSRKATSYGKWACEKFTKELTDLGITIISGLANGIDTVAHKSALDNGGRTIGVLGCGIDVVYPPNNLSLYREMEKLGAIISEFPLGTAPFPYNFPQRNRIISGMSMGVLVIEAQEKSGSLITASHASEQGKDVFALPGNINSIFSAGTNKLIRDGARPLLELEDIIEEIYELKQLKEKSKSNNIIDYSNFSETEIQILRLLEDGPMHCDSIAYRSNLNISDVNSMLTILELKGVIKELSGRVFCLY